MNDFGDTVLRDSSSIANATNDALPQRSKEYCALRCLIREMLNLSPCECFVEYSVFVDAMLCIYHKAKQDTPRFQTKSMSTQSDDNTYKRAFITAIKTITHQNIETEKEAYAAWASLHEKKKTGLWEEVGKYANITGKQAHDRFHNKWSKQFCDDITPYKERIKELIIQGQGNLALNRRVYTSDLIQRIQAQLPSINFHYQTLYQFINYQLKKLQPVSNSFAQVSSQMEQGSFVNEEQSIQQIDNLISSQKQQRDPATKQPVNQLVDIAALQASHSFADVQSSKVYPSFLPASSQSDPRDQEDLAPYNLQADGRSNMINSIFTDEDFRILQSIVDQK